MSGYYFNLPREEDLTIGQQIALEEPNPIAISGGPGTGKSVVSLWRHIRNYKAKLRKKKLTSDIYNYIGSIPRRMLPHRKSGSSKQCENFFERETKIV